MVGLGGTGATPLLERLGRSAANGVGGARGGDNPNHPVPSSKRKASGPWWGHVLRANTPCYFPGPEEADVYRYKVRKQCTHTAPGPTGREEEKSNVYRYVYYE
jgi:hypothetical protein